MKPRSVHLAMVCGLFAALLACTASRPKRSGQAPTPLYDGGVRPMDAAVMDASHPVSMDASPIPGAMDATLVTGFDGATGAADSGRDARADATSDAGAPFLGQARLELLTKPSPMSRYAPRNLLAVWVEDQASMPVKVLARWGGVSSRALTIFNQRVPGAFGGFFSTPIDGSVPIAQLDPDVITAATARMHIQHALVWDLTDYQGIPVPDGTYSIYVETNDGTGESGLAVIELIKGPEPFLFEQGESERFVYVRLTYQPADG